MVFRTILIHFPRSFKAGLWAMIRLRRLEKLISNFHGCDIKMSVSNLIFPWSAVDSAVDPGMIPRSNHGWKTTQVYIIFVYIITQKFLKIGEKIPNYTIDNSIIQNQNSDMKLFYPKIRWKISSTTSSCLFISWPTTIVLLNCEAELIYIQIDRCLHCALILTRPIIFKGICGRMGHYGRYGIGNIS